MPNTASAKKSLRVGIRRNVENRRIKSSVRQIVKKASAETLPEVFSALDKAAKKNVIHPNKAARLKSRISKAVTREGFEGIKAVKKVVRAKKTTARKAIATKTKAIKAKAIAKKTVTKKR